MDGHAHPFATTYLLDFGLPPWRAGRFHGQLQSDCVLQFVKVVDSILELCLESSPCDVAALDAGEAILLKFANHLISPQKSDLVKKKAPAIGTDGWRGITLLAF
jgi:hypothetical protein